jgi:hypothetical protein
LLPLRSVTLLQQRFDLTQVRSLKITNRADHVRAPSKVSSVAPVQQGRFEAA